PGLGVGVDGHRARPQLLRAHPREGDGGLAIHAWRLRRVRVQAAAGDDAHAVMLPARFGPLLRCGRMIVVVLAHEVFSLSAAGRASPCRSYSKHGDDSGPAWTRPI